MSGANSALLGTDLIFPAFTEHLTSGTLHERLFTASNLWLVATALGPEETRRRLIPFLAEDHHFCGEIKAIVAGQLESFSKLVVGPIYAQVLVAPLRNLADSEDFYVRNQAISSLLSICKEIPTAQADAVLAPLLLGLYQAPHPTSHVAACTLTPSLYTRTSHPTQLKLRRAFLGCMKDSLPSVRRSALLAIPAFCSLLKRAVILNEIVRQGVVERVIDDD
jgi:serine/threonine-protein phosphatase 2A regulatory subunit A